MRIISLHEQLEYYKGFFVDRVLNKGPRVHILPVHTPSLTLFQL